MTRICWCGRSVGNGLLSKQEPMFNEAKPQASPFLKEEPEAVLFLWNRYPMYVNEPILAQKIQQLDCCLWQQIEESSRRSCHTAPGSLLWNWPCKWGERDTEQFLWSSSVSDNTIVAFFSIASAEPFCGDSCNIQILVLNLMDVYRTVWKLYGCLLNLIWIFCKEKQFA